jgi:predicted neutral ceramidase superfamily lipid hydrolase
VEQPVDGFEGAGLLAQVFVGIAVSVVALFLVTVYVKFSKGQQQIKRSGYVWAALCAYALSVFCGFQFTAFAFTDDTVRTAIWATAGHFSRLRRSLLR